MIMPLTNKSDQDSSELTEVNFKLSTSPTGQQKAISTMLNSHSWEKDIQFCRSSKTQCSDRYGFSSKILEFLKSGFSQVSVFPFFTTTIFMYSSIKSRAAGNMHMLLYFSMDPKYTYHELIEHM